MAVFPQLEKSLFQSNWTSADLQTTKKSEESFIRINKDLNVKNSLIDNEVQSRNSSSSSNVVIKHRNSTSEFLNKTKLPTNSNYKIRN